MDIKASMTSYLTLENEIEAFKLQIQLRKNQQLAIEKQVHEYMRNQNIDEMNVKHIRFSRVMKTPRKPTMKDADVKTVLHKHLAGEDGKLRVVLEDLAQVRAISQASAITQEVLVRRAIKKNNTPQ